MAKKKRSKEKKNKNIYVQIIADPETKELLLSTAKEVLTLVKKLRLNENETALIYNSNSIVKSLKYLKKCINELKEYIPERPENTPIIPLKREEKEPEIKEDITENEELNLLIQEIDKKLNE